MQSTRAQNRHAIGGIRKTRMGNTTSIIVYRNPAEAAFWESGMAWPLFVSLAFAVLWIWVLSRVAHWANRCFKIGRSDRRYVWAEAVAVIIGLAAAAGSAWLIL